MSQDFEIEILTPAKKLYSAKGSEVVLPAYDGEVGILPGHSDFIGKLGTGALKVVTNGDDFWFAVSGGVYQVIEGKLAVFAVMGEDARQVNVDAAKTRLSELEKKLAAADVAPEEFEVLQNELSQQKARLDVHKRTALVN